MRYVAIRSEGGLIPYDLLDKIASEDAAGQKPGDFGLPKGRRLTDEVSRVWADAQSLWSNFKRRRESLGDRDPYGTSITRSWIGSLLGDVDMLGFDLKLQASAVVVNNSTYAISHRSGEGEDAIPVHIEGLKIDLDRRLHTKLRTSPQAMVQDFLNNGEQTVVGDCHERPRVCEFCETPLVRHGQPILSSIWKVFLKGTGSTSLHCFTGFAIEAASRVRDRTR